VRAYVFLRVGALLGNQEATTSLEAVSRSLTSAQLAQARAELIKTFQEAAAQQGRTLTQAEQNALLDTEDKNGPTPAVFKFVKAERVYVVAVDLSHDKRFRRVDMREQR
jgi:hypothetical protein